VSGPNTARSLPPTNSNKVEDLSLKVPREAHWVSKRAIKQLRQAPSLVASASQSWSVLRVLSISKKCLPKLAVVFNRLISMLCSSKNKLQRI